MHSPSLLTLHESLLASFDLPVPSPATYFPHMSLVYADLTADTKASMIEGMKQRGEVVERDGRTEVVGEVGFVPVEILLVRTGGPSDEWEVLARVAL